MTATAERAARVILSKDGLRATLSTRNLDPAGLSAEHLITALRELGARITPEVEARVVEVVRQARNGGLGDEPVVLAQGVEPVEGSPATFTLTAGEQPPAEADESDRVDFYRSQILTVRAGDVLGLYTPEVPHTPGVDIAGRPVPCRVPLRSVHLGSNVRLAEDGRTVVAEAAGKVQITSGSVSVIEVVEIAGDVDFNTGDLDVPTHLVVNGTIREGFGVRSGASITVRGAIEACRVEAAGDLQVNGGIVGQGRGLLLVGGEVFAKFCNEVTIRVVGNLIVAHECLNSRLHTDGHLTLLRGATLGGYTYARLGAEMPELGNEAEVRTVLALGLDPAAIIEARAIDARIRKRREAAEKIRSTVQPLLNQLKRLTPDQRERATELMYQADTLDQEVGREERRRDELLTRAGPPADQPASLVIRKAIYPGVTLIFGDRLTRITRVRKGHFRILRRRGERCEEIVLIDRLSGSVTSLPMYELDPELVPPALEAVPGSKAESTDPAPQPAKA